jgi:hypothetical protein
VSGYPYTSIYVIPLYISTYIYTQYPIHLECSKKKRKK